RGVAGHVHMGDEPAARPDRDIRSDHAIWPDLPVLRDLCAALHASRRMNARHSGDHGSAIIAPRLASQAIRPPTLASPRNHQMFLRLARRFMWYSTRSPGITGRRNFALSMVMKYTSCGGRFLPSDSAQIAPALC